MADPFADAADEARQARDAVNSATVHSQRALSEAVSAAERTIQTATRSAEKILRETLEALRTETAPYTEGAIEHIEDGQRYISDHVKQRPMTFTLAGLGVGLLLGLLLSSRSK
jgi:ElaB/YqjD/DUF883 family membrane-anchored ribosome-binding protein